MPWLFYMQSHHYLFAAVPGVLSRNAVLVADVIRTRETLHVTPTLIFRDLVNPRPSYTSTTSANVTCSLVRSTRTVNRQESAYNACFSEFPQGLFSQ
ncbi:hypothetical protein BaRGS_00020708 [Batillaria attramentaria]|uniref:Secreted protein n=1 Tax=Batillaria attramentaria TaxID=370345 RepID=A0ABD0KLU5_9CAEN